MAGQQTPAVVRRDPYVDVEAASEYLDKPVSWVRNNSDRLRLPRYRVGNQWRYRLSEIDDWMSQGAGSVR